MENTAFLYNLITALEMYILKFCIAHFKYACHTVLYFNESMTQCPFAEATCLTNNSVLVLNTQPEGHMCVFIQLELQIHSKK